MDWLPLTELADEGSFARGEDYAARGLINIVASTDNQVRALARGTSTYDVRLHRTEWSCTCPVGFDGLFCKHLVATALVASGDVRPEPEPDAPDAIAPLAEWLSKLGVDDLMATLDELDRTHPEAVEMLARLQAKASGDVSAYTGLVESLHTRRYLDWRAANEHGDEAHAVVDELASALTPATAAVLLPLLERAFGHMVKVILRSDDSSGIQSSAARRLLDLHAKAAALASPDPVKLARWLVKAGIDQQDFFHFDVVEYADALGERGLATYRKELGKRLAKNPDGYAANHALERLAVQSRDLDEIVRLVGKDLAGPYHYQHLVDALLDADLRYDALRYAIEGIHSKLVPHQTIRLYDAAVHLLSERGDDDEILRLRQEQLRRIPDETSYASLRKAAQAKSVWPTERLTALDLLLEHDPRAWLTILVKEDEVDLAWQASLDMELSPSLLLMLARARGRTHPQDTFDPYVVLVDDILRQSVQQNYRQAVAWLRELRPLVEAAGMQQEYAALIARLLEQHRRRPTLVKMLRPLVR